MFVVVVVVVFVARDKGRGGLREHVERSGRVESSEESELSRALFCGCPRRLVLQVMEIGFGGAKLAHWKHLDDGQPNPNLAL